MPNELSVIQNDKCVSNTYYCYCRQLLYITTPQEKSRNRFLKFIDKTIFISSSGLYEK